MATQGTDAEVAPEQPILWLGMAGFGPALRAQLEAALAESAGHARWRVCTLGEADAWWVNGAGVRVMPGGNLKVAAGLPTERALNLDLSEVDRPVAFAAPLASPDFEPACVFDPASPPSIHAALLQLENWLRSLRARFVLGKQIIQRGTQLRQGVFHISHGGKLLAVLDFVGGKAAIAPSAHPIDLWEATWQKRPVLARDLPSAFIHLTPSQLAWSYVRRTDQDMLPMRYRTDTMYYRGPPDVPVNWLRDSQLMLLRELAAEPGNVAALRQRTGLPFETVVHDLACLYYAGAITTTKRKGTVPLMPRTGGDSLSSVPFHSATGERAQSITDLTAPASLEHRRLQDPDLPAPH